MGNVNPVNTIRFLSVDAVEEANSGHPGLPMGGATMAWVLWSQFLKHNPAEPKWADRDRFVLSAGHGSMLLYSLLHLFGYGVEMDDLKNFRQWGSITPGHPEYGMTPGVETTTGPLGQGFANAVGLAMAERRLAAEFNRPGHEVVDHHTWVYAGDGCMMEGITYEAASLAGHHRLGKLICLYDDNEITIDGSTSLAFTEDVDKRFEALGWQVLRVADGNDAKALAAAMQAAKEESSRPSLIMVRTVIGYGSPNKQGKSAAHGSPLGGDEVALARETMNWPHPPFHVPAEVREEVRGIRERLDNDYKSWEQGFAQWSEANPQESERWQRWHSGQMDISNLEGVELNKPLATRAVSGKVMQLIAGNNDNLVGGSADLNGSTNTYLDGKGDFTPENPRGNNIYFGVREHAMAAISNGLALHGGLRAYCSTFLVFSDYLKPALRLSALSHLPVVYVFTHDSIGVGEDGPTHQPVEHLAMLRSVPNVHVLRPADGAETVEAWKYALSRNDGPTVLALSRQALPQLEGSGRLERGGYVLAREKGTPDLVIIATGSEVQLAVSAAGALAGEGIDVRVVSMPCREVFGAQDEEYKSQVLPGIPRLVLEAGISLGWEGIAGPRGKIIAVDRFGASAPGPVVMEELGFGIDNVVSMAKSLLAESR